MLASRSGQGFMPGRIWPIAFTLGLSCTCGSPAWTPELLLLAGHCCLAFENVTQSAIGKSRPGHALDAGEIGGTRSGCGSGSVDGFLQTLLESGQVVTLPVRRLSMRGARRDHTRRREDVRGNPRTDAGQVGPHHGFASAGRRFDYHGGRPAKNDGSTNTSGRDIFWQAGFGRPVPGSRTDRDASAGAAVRRIHPRRYSLRPGWA